jgi:ribonucleoside-diphosphate reductase alpha chain
MNHTKTMSSATTDDAPMSVIKRDGSREPVSFDKVLERIRRAARGLSSAVNYTRLAQLVLAEIHDGVHTTELDELAARLAISYMSTHPDWGTLAAQIIVSNCQRSAPATFSAAMELLATVTDARGNPAPALAADVLAFIREHADTLNAMVQPERDFALDYFGFKTLEKAYLMRGPGRKVAETPQYMWLRVAVGLWASGYNSNRDLAGNGCSDIATTSELPIPTRLERIQQTYDLMSQKAFTHATPTLFNAGTPRPQMSSCFLAAMKDDSIDGIFDTLKECAQISKYAGGIGLHVHNIRASGTPIAGTFGTSNGLVPMLRVFNNTARYVDQGGGKRNGSFAIYLEPWHADIQAFLKLKSNTGTEEERARDLFYALWIPDLFMRRVEAGGDWSLFCPHEAPGLADVHGADFDALYTRYEAEGRARVAIPAQKLWSEILVSQIETGTPYLLYKDAANAKSNQKNLGTIKSSNLCVAPETLILTDKGHLPIATLAGQTVNVWNGDQWSETTVVKTGENQSLIKVVLSNGATLDCTPYHKFILNSKRTTVRLPSGYTKNTYDSLSEAVRIDAKDLKPGMQLAKWSAPVVEGSATNDLKYPYTHGFFCGDGTVGNDGATLLISLYGEKKELIPYLDIRTSSGMDDSSGRRNVILHNDISPKYTVPMNATVSNKLLWFAGLADADGTAVLSEGGKTSIQIGSVIPEFLEKIRLMLLTLGVQSKVRLMREASTREMPDGRGGKKMYACKAMYRLLISADGVRQLKTLGFSPKRLIISDTEMTMDMDRFVKVVEVIDEGRLDDTYCFNEPLNHVGVFNGVATGQCTEVVEYSSPEETAVCNLASIALPHFVTKTTPPTFNFAALRDVVAIIVRNLNRVIDINFYPTPETKRSNMRHRPVGLGVQGLADVFALLGLAWETPEAALLNRRIFEHIYYAAIQASANLAAEEGTYETYAGSPASQGLLQPDLWGLAPADYATASELDWPALRATVATHGLRNSLLMAPMPTASTSQILGYNECIEPFTTNIYARRTLAGEFTVVNRHLVADLQAAGLWTPELKERIIAANGSIQNLAEVPAPLKARYKTVWEIKQKTLIDMAADRGAFICQSQSLNLFVQDPTIAKLSSMHFYAWRRGLKTGIYYLRTKSAVQAIKFTVDPRLVASAATASATPSGGAGSTEPAECLLCSS